MSRNEKKAEYAELSALVDNIRKATKAATDYADKHGLEFRFPAPSYGMGGWYAGLGHEDRQETDRYGDESDGWYASSQSC